MANTEKINLEVTLNDEEVKRKIAEIQNKILASGQIAQEQASQAEGHALRAIEVIDQKQKSSGKQHTKDDAEWEKWDKYLEDYCAYLKKKAEVTKKFDNKIAGATTDNDKESLGKEKTKTLEGLDTEVKGKTDAMLAMFTDMSEKSIGKLARVSGEFKDMISYVKAGKFEENNSFGISKEQFDLLVASPEKLETIRKDMDKVETASAAATMGFRQMGNGLRQIFNSDTGSAEYREGLKNIEGGFKDVMAVGKATSSALSNLGTALGSDTLGALASGLDTVMGVMDATMDGAKAGAMFGPIGAAAGAAIGFVSSLGAAIAQMMDAKKEREIIKLQEQVDALGKAYDKLGKAVDKAYSSDASALIAKQDENLEQQKAMIEQQRALEQSKKKADKEKIKNYDKELDEINEKLEQNREKMIEVIFGSDVKSAIDEFAQAYVDAFSKGGTAAEAQKEVVKNMLKSIVEEMIKSDIADKVKYMREKIAAMIDPKKGGDGRLDDRELAEIQHLGDQVSEELEARREMYEKLLKDKGSDNREAAAKGFATASQESVDENNGRLTAIQGHTFSINECVKGLVANSSLIVRHVAGIENNTAYCRRLEGIETDMKSVRNELQLINLKGITIRK